MKKFMETVMERLIARGELFSAEVVMNDYNISRKKFDVLMKKYNKKY